ncbi:hypothetical protein ZWY2020_037003 [Hordeum vulgare]|nr:hypothetical protein ZWY2020_037003 [Hordeum vulgare]
MSRGVHAHLPHSRPPAQAVLGRGSVMISRRRSRSPAATRRARTINAQTWRRPGSGRPVVGNNWTSWDDWHDWHGALTSRRNSSSSARSVMPRTRPWKSITVEMKEAPRGRHSGSTQAGVHSGSGFRVVGKRSESNLWSRASKSSRWVGVRMRSGKQKPSGSRTARRSAPVKASMTLHSPSYSLLRRMRWPRDAERNLAGKAGSGTAMGSPIMAGERPLKRAGSSEYLLALSMRGGMRGTMVEADAMKKRRHGRQAAAKAESERRHGYRRSGRRLSPSQEVTPVRSSADTGGWGVAAISSNRSGGLMADKAAFNDSWTEKSATVYTVPVDPWKAAG